MTLEQQYSNLCAILGDLILNREALDKRILEVRAKIDAINKQAAENAAGKREPKSEG